MTSRGLFFIFCVFCGGGAVWRQRRKIHESLKCHVSVFPLFSRGFLCHPVFVSVCSRKNTSCADFSHKTGFMLAEPRAIWGIGFFGCFHFSFYEVWNMKPTSNGKCDFHRLKKCGSGTFTWWWIPMLEFSFRWNTAERQRPIQLFFVGRPSRIPKFVVSHAPSLTVG